MNKVLNKKTLIPIILAGIALIFSVINSFRFDRVYVFLFIMPVVAAFVLLYILWELPRRNKTILYSVSLIAFFLEIRSVFLILPGTYSYLDLFITHNYFFYQQFAGEMLWANICLIAAFAAMLVMIVESFARKRFSLMASIVMTAGFLGYFILRCVWGSVFWKGIPYYDVFSILCSWLPQILISLSFVFINLFKLFPESENAGLALNVSDRFDAWTVKEGLLLLQDLKAEGRISEEEYLDRRKKLIAKL